MTPVLYSASEQDFTSLGLGVLNDALSCKVDTVLNGVFELEMQYPVTGKRYSDLKVSNIIKATSQHNGIAQLFDIHSITKPLNGVVTVYASHVSNRKQFIPIMPCSASNIADAFIAIKGHSAEDNPFTFWTDKTTSASFKLTSPASLGQVLGGMEGSILDVYRGEYEFDNWTIKFWNHRGQDNGVSLRYGKNITSIEQEESISNTITGVCPFWADADGNTVVIPEAVVESSSADNFPFRRTVVKDFSNVFDEIPTVEQLRNYTQTYISVNNIGVPSVSIDVSYENLADYEEYKNVALFEQVRLGDTVHVYFEPLDIEAEARVVETVYNVLIDKYEKVHVGSVKTSLSNVINADADFAKNTAAHAASKVTNALEQAFIDALASLSGADGGNIVINQNETTGKPYEILIMDTDDVSTARNVLRLNMNGLGLSTNGINGPYTAAITGEGIVATAITTGTLDAAKVNVSNLYANNILVTNSEDVGAAIRRLELSDEGLESTISNIKIGARNYIRALDGISVNTSKQLCTYTYDPTNGTYVLTATARGTSTEFSQIYVAPADVYSISEIAGKECRFHAESIVCSNPSLDARVYIYFMNSSKKVISATDLLQDTLSRSITVPANTVYIQPVLRIDQNKAEATGTTLTVRGLMLEVGNKDSDWVPAHEDANAQMGAMQTSIEQNAESIILSAQSINQRIDKVTNGYGIIWDLNAGGDYAGGEARIQKYDHETGTFSNAAGWLMWNGTKRTVPVTDFNPNTMVPYNVPIYLVLRLTSADGTTGTIYPVWYNGGWKYLNKGANASTSGQAVASWTWVENTDIILGSCVEPGSEKQFTETVVYDPPRTYKSINESVITKESLAASISVNARNIELKVSSTDYTGAKIASKINQSPSSVVIEASHISLSGKTINLTSDNIAINSTNFSVDKNGTATAKSLNITGGSINITTTDQTLDIIRLNHTKSSTYISSSMFIVENKSTADNPYLKVTMQGGGVWMSNTNLNKTLATLYTTGGGGVLDLYNTSDSEESRLTSGSLRLIDGKGKLRMLCNKSGLSFYSDSAKEISNIASTSSGIGSLYLKDGTRARCIVNDGGAYWYSSTGTLRCWLNPTSGLIFYNASGKVTKTYSAT